MRCFWMGDAIMKKPLSKFTLEETLKVETFYYFNSRGQHNFTDNQFGEFIAEQLECGLDPIEIELIDNEAMYYADSPRNEILFFENIIDQERKEAREAFEQENSDVSRMFKQLAMAGLRA